MAKAGQRGIPLLSGPAPSLEPDANSCRKCNKEFNMLFARSRKCNHCGHLYCQSCTDYQALQPRSVDGASVTGYEPVPVCAFCIENLTITAAGKGQLRGLTIAKLRKYANDYSINVSDIKEKDDLIDRLISRRQPNGCLPPNTEAFYRRHSIPKRSGEPRGFFSRAMNGDQNAEASSSSSSSRPQPQQTPPYQQRESFPRPDLEQSGQAPSWTQFPGNSSEPQRPAGPQWQSQQNYHSFSQGSRNSQTSFHSFSQSRPQTTYTPPPGPPPQPTYNPPPGPPPPQQTPHSGPSLNVPPANSRPRSASAPRTPTPSAPTTRATSPSPSIPTLEELLEMSPEAVRALSISSLKAILFRNHVNTGMIVEKAELVAKVQTLIQQERLEREDAARRQDEEDAELREALELSRREHEERQARVAREEGGDDATGPAAHEGQPADGAPPPGTSSQPAEAAPPPPGKLSAKAQAMASHLERTGLCVICQDEEANIAIVDCGHLAMCRACSDLIMSGTRECPLCRTRIVTESRLLRIYKA